MLIENKEVDNQDDGSELLEWPDANPEEISQSELQEMKRMGLAKPKGVKVSDWNAVQELAVRHDLVINLKAEGYTNKMIAHKTGYSPGTISSIVNSEKGKAILNDISKSARTKIRKGLEVGAEKAVGVMYQVMTDQTTRPQLKVDCAKYFIDQGVGKAKQELEVKGNLLYDMSERLLRDDTIVIDGKQIEDIEVEESPFKEMLKESIGDNSYTVGKRNKTT